MKTSLIYLVLLLFSSYSLSEESTDQQNWQTWIHDYDQYNQSSEGWLSLVGLYWLKQGENTLGSAKGNHHRLPKNLPAVFGKILVDKDSLTLDRKSVV